MLVLFACRTMPGTSYCSVNICGMNEFPDEEIAIHFFYSDCFIAELFFKNYELINNRNENDES